MRCDAMRREDLDGAGQAFHGSTQKRDLCARSGLVRTGKYYKESKDGVRTVHTLIEEGREGDRRLCVPITSHTLKSRGERALRKVCCVDDEGGTLGYIGAIPGSDSPPAMLERTTLGERGQEISWLGVAIPLAHAHTHTSTLMSTVD